MNYLTLIEQQVRELVKNDPDEEDILDFIRDKVAESFRNGLTAARRPRTNSRSKVGFNS